MSAMVMAQPVAYYQSAHKRPKLSLQTASLPLSYTCSSRALPVNIIPSTAATPTTLNTFNNTYDLSYRPSPVPQLDSARSARRSRSRSPRPSKRNDRLYNIKLSYGVRSILKNNASRADTTSASPCTSTRRVFFPQPKTVSFKKDLEEEIVTIIYTAKHLDLFAKSEDESIAVLSSIEPSEEWVSIGQCSTEGDPINAQHGLPKNHKRKHNQNDRVYTVASDSTMTISDTISTPKDKNGIRGGQTQCSSRKKRRWEWTLAPSAQQESSINAKANLTSVDHETEAEWVVVSSKSTRLEQVSSSENRSCKRRRAASAEDDVSSCITPDLTSRRNRAASW